MKKIFVFAAIGMAAIAASQALAARPYHAHSTTKLMVAMHDPGCHSFLVHGKFLKADTVTGPVRLMNMDEATLKVTSSAGTKLIPVGKNLLVTKGHYVVTMVGQAPDDNHLKLTVN